MIDCKVEWAIRVAVRECCLFVDFLHKGCNTRGSRRNIWFFIGRFQGRHHNNGAVAEPSVFQHFFNVLFRSFYLQAEGYTLATGAQ